MGLSSLPSPSEGVLSIVLVNTAISVAVFKEILSSILHVIGFRENPSDSGTNPADPFEFRSLTSPESLADEFRCRNPSVRFGSVFSSPTEHDCRVCLNRFEPDSQINRLTCGHFFHTGCIEKWLDYWNVTCPLCRNPFVDEEEEALTCPWL
eukprot:TRINITY_DN1369_c0_g1_i1.p1 TRINITY_DN1369_c0_g1~~TRINITY_DN1369_c0_g1_i1.p1  ORF type:complete len:151 (-),score=1.50 TRINITY_DN1369_c0_g1_i1:75-527(-)